MNAGGIISDEEFALAKQRLLHGNQRSSGVVPATSALAYPPASDDTFAWMTLPLRRYAQFDGRSSRKEYWLFLLLTNAVALGLVIVALADTNDFVGTGLLGSFAIGLLFLGMLGLLVPFLAVEVRRLHDQGKSGWFALLNLIPYIGPVIVLILMLLPGTEGENRYGPDPRV